MRPSTVILAPSLVLLALVSFAAADDTYLVVQQLPGPTSATLHRMSADGRFLGSVTVLPSKFYPRDLVMAEDNRSFRVVGYFGFSLSEACIYDVSPNGRVQRWISGPPLFRPLTLFRDGGGDWIVADEGRSRRLELYRVRGTSVTWLASAPGVVPIGVARDPESGMLIVRGETAPYPNTRPGYYRVDPATGTVTSFALPTNRPGFSALYGARHLPWEATTGGFLDAVHDYRIRGMEFTRVHAATGITPLTSPAFMMIPLDVIERSGRSFPVRYTVLTRGQTVPISFYLYDLKASGQPVVGRVLPTTPELSNRGPALRIGDRHLTWFMDRAPNGRRLELGFPGEGGRAYAVALSVTGVRPGVTLADGRVIPLEFDAITWVSLNGGLPGTLEGTVGHLDASGLAAVKLDTNPLGGRLKGLCLWAAAVVLDANAPSGVAEVVGPSLVEFTR